MARCTALPWSTATQRRNASGLADGQAVQLNMHSAPYCRYIVWSQNCFHTMPFVSTLLLTTELQAPVRVLGCLGCG